MPSSLVFTTTDWLMPHPVTITGVDDSKVDGPSAVFDRLWTGQRRPRVCQDVRAAAGLR